MVQLSIVLPTYNERENLPILLEKLQQVCQDIPHEVIIVDDNSPDNTWQLAQQLQTKDSSISVIRRIHRKGLSSAILEGLLLGRGERLLVMDADLQHDMNLIPAMFRAGESCDVVIGSRYLHQTQVPGWNDLRLKISRAGTWLAGRILQQRVTDPLSGFFMVRKQVVHEVAPSLQKDGFKILLDILLHRPELKITELPYQFGNRLHGESKLDTKVMLDFADLLISRTFLFKFNIQFVRYGVIGGLGVFLHFLVLFFLYARWQWPYPISLLIAIQIALISNYIWNNQWTFSEQRFLRLSWWRGFSRYNLACSVGTAFNILIGWYLVHQGISWVLGSIFGIWVGISWNYLAHKNFTWKV